MKRSEAKEFLPLIQAFAEGKTIQVKGYGEWIDLKEPNFARPVADYRIKPEPRTFYAVEYGGGIAGSPVTENKSVAERWLETSATGAHVITLREVLDD